MGHREQLLAGAKKCLLEKGFARTTARDIVAASGTNLASIGYHFGSKDNLLVEAMIEANSEWADEVEKVLAEAADVTPAKRLEVLWAGLIDSFRREPGLWRASAEFMQLVHERPEIKQMLADAYVMARKGLASLFLNVPEDEVDDESAMTIGGLLLATVPGLMGQWALDTERSPSAADMVAGFRRIQEIMSRS